MVQGLGGLGGLSPSLLGLGFYKFTGLWSGALTEI